MLNNYTTPYHHIAKDAIATDILIYSFENLEVRVDLQPIGGFRGKVGALAINHAKNKQFTDWTKKDLHDLSHLTRKILSIQETQNVKNILIYGKQDKGQPFTVKIIPYPTCSWLEKMEGFLHVIFGAPTLNFEQGENIASFYQSTLEDLNPPITGASTIPHFKIDAFCKDAVISSQQIREINFGGNDFHLLHDKWPKSVSAQDPHLLIVPKGSSGHCDGSGVTEEKRLAMLGIAQKVMEYFLEKEKYKTCIVLERNGEQLQGVQHKHFHVMAVSHFPTTFWEKMIALFRQLFYTPTPSNFKERLVELDTSLPILTH